MPYLAVKKVKGRHYGYLQESYREGGKVRTRTVQYLGAIDPAVAQQVKDTRRQLGQVDMAALVQSVRKATETATTPVQVHSVAEIGRASPALPDSPPVASEPPRMQRMDVNGQSAVVDTETGAIVSHDVDMNTGRLIPLDDKTVITTRKQSNPLRPFQNSLKLPDKLETYGVSLQALQATHQRYGQRLKDLQINPAVMPDVRIAYGHPDGLKRNRDGSYTITTSRRTQNKRHPINKTQLWKNYRQALASATLDAIADDQPELYRQLQTELDESHKATNRLLFSAFSQTASPVERLGLSLQIIIWNKLPKALIQKGKAEDFGQVDFSTAGDWRREAAHVLAECQKAGGWTDLEDRTKASRRKLRASITKRRNQLEDMTSLQSFSARLSGKRRKIIRQIMADEAKLAASNQLSQRISILREHFLR